MQRVIILIWISVFGAPASSPGQPMPTALERIAGHLQAGIYERIVNLGYVPSPEIYNRRDVPEAHNEYTLLFLRFYDIAPGADSSVYIGKVFMSERYLENHYNKAYTSRADYANDKDGKFMVCKLYVDERSLEYRLAIYPDHLLNLCRPDGDPVKGMHFNRVACTTAEQHWQSLRYVVSLTDKHADDFSKTDEPGALEQFLVAADPRVNIDRQYLTTSGYTADSILFRPTGRKTSHTLRTINLHKQLKLFRIGSLDDNPADVGKTLTLKFTKYPLSEDLIEGPEYTYDFLAYDQLNDSLLAERGRYGTFVSRNPLYRSLIVSPTPDDRFVPGLDLPPDQLLSYQGNDTDQSARIGPAAAPGRIRREDYTLSAVQQAVEWNITDPINRATVSALRGQLFITSMVTRTDFWVYAGIDPAKRFRRGDTLQLPDHTYLRDGMPVMSPDKPVWLKGRLTAYRGKFYVQPTARPAARTCLVKQVHSIPAGGHDYQWLNVSFLSPDGRVRKRVGPRR